MGKVEKIKNSQAVQNIEKDAVEGVSQIGTDLRDRLEFIAKTYEDINGDIKEVPGLIIDNFSVTETIEKQIVKTQLTSGITTEQVGEGTYNFTINLKLISNNFDKKPEDEIRTLKQIVNAETSIEVYSRVFDLVRRVRNCYRVGGNGGRKYKYDCLHFASVRE